MSKIRRPAGWVEHTLFVLMLIGWAIWMVGLVIAVAIYVHWIAAVGLTALCLRLVFLVIRAYVRNSIDDGPKMAWLAQALGLVRNDRRVITLPPRLKSNRN